MQRSRLTNIIKTKILGSEALIGMIADKLKMKGHSVRESIKKDSQQPCLPHYQQAIREVLGLPDGTEITEVYTAQPELSNHE